MDELQQAFEQLCADYCHYLDDGDADNWSALFAPEGRFIRRSKPLIAGRADLRRFVVERPATRSIHLILNSNIRAHPSSNDGIYHATATYAGANIDSVSSKPAIVAVGMYRDIIQEIDGALRFVQRDVTRLF